MNQAPNQAQVPNQSPIEPQHHACFGGYAACSGCSPCPACWRQICERVLVPAIMAAQLNGQAAVDVQNMVAALRQRGIDPQHQLGASAAILALQPQDQVNAFWAASEYAMNELHSAMGGMRGSFRVRDAATGRVVQDFGPPPAPVVQAPPQFVPQYTPPPPVQPVYEPPPTQYPQVSPNQWHGLTKEEREIPGPVAPVGYAVNVPATPPGVTTGANPHPGPPPLAHFVNMAPAPAPARRPALTAEEIAAAGMPVAPEAKTSSPDVNGVAPAVPQG